VKNLKKKLDYFCGKYGLAIFGCSLEDAEIFTIQELEALNADGLVLDSFVAHWKMHDKSPVQPGPEKQVFMVWDKSYFDFALQMFPRDDQVFGKFCCVDQDDLKEQLRDVGHQVEDCRWEWWAEPESTLGESVSLRKLREI